MKRFASQEPAPYGIYVSARPLDVHFVGQDGEVLAGRAGASYRRLPMAAVVALGPALGGAFVMAFPLLVVVAVLGAVAGLAVRAASGSRHAYVAQGGWQPAASYFSGKEANGEEARGAQAEGVGELEAEVAQRAQAEKR